MTMPMRFTPTLVAGLLLAAATPGAAQAPIRYEISFPNAGHHEAEITVVFPDLNPGTLEIRMSRTSPGRYALHEFAKNVYDFRATGADGRAVVVERPNLHQWNVSDHGGEVRVTYTLYGDHADGTYTGIDLTHGHLNMPATFVWARGLEARPMELTVRVPEGSGWRVATQLAPTDDPYRFTAPNLDYWMDSPTEVSDFWETSWQVQGPDGPETVRIALHHTGTDAEAEAYARGAMEIVRAEQRVYGTFPRYDYGTYTFLACYLPWADGDGMEHRNSTVLTSTGSLARAPQRLLGTVAHEYFHSWNMERIRSQELEPFDFEHADMSRELWFGEGFTSYYTDLSMWRAGIVDDEGFAAAVGRAAAAVVNARGRRYASPIEMSMQAPFVDAAVSVDETNFANTFLSYYTWGEGIGLGLDLTLRTRFPGVALDDLMREMWRTHGSPEIPYGVDDIETALARVTGDAGFAHDFFQRYVRGRDVVDYVTLLAAAGIRFGPAEPGRPSIGPVRLGPGGEGVVVDGPTLVDTPLYDVGVDRGDEITALGGRRLRRPQDVEAALGGHRPGERLEIRWVSRGQEHRAMLSLAQDESLSASLASGADDDAGRLRAAWKEGEQ
jgi:predicted metalloprotease with PDZ domain